MRRVLGLLGSVVLGTLLCGAAAGQDLPLFGYPFPLSRTDSASGEGDSRPDLATDGHGTWVAVWYGWNSLGGTIGSTDHDILVARSMNDGVTWTPPAALNTNAGSDSGNDTRPRVATDGRGTWVAAWQSFDSLDGTIGTDSDILVARSTDGGASWSAPAALNTNASSDAGDDWRPHLTTDGQGTWVAVWYSFDTLGGTIGIDSDILVARSTDGGASWSAPAALNTSAGYDYLNAHDERPQVATDGLGNWLTVWESEYSFGAIGNDSDIVASRSTDGGATWTQARALNSDAGGDFRTDFAVRVATDSQGAWVAAWTSGGTDWDIEVARSSDAGAGWTWPVFLNSNAAWDGGGDLYPDLTTDGRGNWVAVWESDDVLSGAAGSDKDIFVARSMDDGATWAPPIALNTNAGSDAGENGHRHPGGALDRRRGQLVRADRAQRRLGGRLRSAVDDRWTGDLGRGVGLHRLARSLDRDGSRHPGGALERRLHVERAHRPRSERSQRCWRRLCCAGDDRRAGDLDRRVGFVRRTRRHDRGGRRHPGVALGGRRRLVERGGRARPERRP
jgi:hypothetical protein